MRGPEHGRSGGFLGRLRSVRTRITAAVVLLTSLALAGSGLAAYLVQSARVDRDITQNVEQELEEFRTLQTRGIDPRTGEEFTSVVRLLEVALQRNVPDEHEALISYWDGALRRVQAGAATPFEDATTVAEVIRLATPLGTAIENLIPQGGSRFLETEAGNTLIAVQPVNDDATRGAYVVVSYVDLERAEFLDTMRTYGYVAAAALLMVAASAWAIAGQLLRPVRELRVTAQEISETDLTRRIEATGNDDLTELTVTFNAMLDRLEEAFSTQRQFLDDAGHELRTPITIIRGHLELVDTADAQEVATTRALVLDEIDRMSRMVDDLIVLAKSRRPGFLTPTEVEVDTLTDEVADKMRILGDRCWEVDARAEGRAVFDPQRITQALLQLASNAVRHTKPTDVIALGSAISDSSVEFWVRDNGTGIKPADQERVFERFQRGSDAQRSSHDEGSGLGLSIVAAIAHAHGGEIHLDSTPGSGATFRLTIPLTAVGAAA